MTSAEIKAIIERSFSVPPGGVIDVIDPLSSVAFATLEIAYQLAVHNEREAADDEPRPEANA